MAKLSFKCKDLGFACDFEVKGVATKDEILGVILKHAERCHELTAITPEVGTKISKAIKGQAE